MTDHVEFETRLTAALGRYAERAPVTVDAGALVRAVSVGNRRRRVATLRSARPATLLAAALLAILAAAVGLVVGSWLLSQHASLPGAFTKAVPMWSETSQTVMARLQDGRVLIVGGTALPADRTAPLPPGAELFDPSATR